MPVGGGAGNIKLSSEFRGFLALLEGKSNAALFGLGWVSQYSALWRITDPEQLQKNAIMGTFPDTMRTPKSPWFPSRNLVLMRVLG